ncbi:hypothetical protein UXO11_21680 [Enterobacter wuhouensis]|uniref:hypothetical protein n=1 Tax=Enterobacter wuhouensis TaxID=2529381 RepID=UPI002FD0660F
MAIVAGWIGSSAVSTTGARWMSAAGSGVKVGTPFWMSGLVGKMTLSVASTSNPADYFTDGISGWNSQYVIVNLSSPFTGTVTTNNSGLVVDTTNRYLKGDPTTNIDKQYGSPSINVTNVSTLYVGIPYPAYRTLYNNGMNGKSSDKVMKNLTWQFIAGGSVIGTFTSNFSATFQF